MILPIRKAVSEEPLAEMGFHAWAVVGNLETHSTALACYNVSLIDISALPFFRGFSRTGKTDSRGAAMSETLKHTRLRSRVIMMKKLAENRYNSLLCGY
jgi:hypothetical protein